MDSPAAPITRHVWRRFAGDAVVWLLPALVLLPVYLVVLVLSMLAESGELLQPFFEKHRGFHGALGVLLVMVAIAVAVFVAGAATEALDYVEGGFAVLVTGGLGGWLCHRQLRRLAAGRAG